MQQDKDEKSQGLRAAGRLTIIELMTFLAVLGVLLTWVLKRFLA